MLMMRMTGMSGGRRDQRGAALITSLVLLLVMTLLATTTIRNATLEERMAANSAFRQQAFQAAESAGSEAFGSDRSTYAAAMLPATASSGAYEVDAGLSGFGDSSDLEGSATIRYLRLDGTPPCGESSMGEGAGMALQYFEIDADGGVTKGGDDIANAALTEGVAICGPAG